MLRFIDHGAYQLTPTTISRLSRSVRERTSTVHQTTTTGQMSARIFASLAKFARSLHATSTAAETLRIRDFVAASSCCLLSTLQGHQSAGAGLPATYLFRDTVDRATFMSSKQAIRSSSRGPNSAYRNFSCRYPNLRAHFVRPC